MRVGKLHRVECAVVRIVVRAAARCRQGRVLVLDEGKSREQYTAPAEARSKCPREGKHPFLSTSHSRTVGSYE